MKNEWRAVKELNKFNLYFGVKPRAHLFIRRLDQKYTSACHRVTIHHLSETIRITEAHCKCKYCIPFEIRRKPC